MSVRDMVNQIPYPVQQGIRYFYGALPPRVRYGKVFRNTYAFLQESQYWSREELDEYQLEQLSKLLHHAYQNVPYYRRIFDESGLKPKDIQDFRDLQLLPYLTKNIVQENLMDLVARNYSKSKLQYVTTGGSTGTPLGFYLEKEVSAAREWAFMLTQWNRAGFKIGDRCVILRGNVVGSSRKGKFWEYDPINKNLVLSSYHMTDETLPKYIEKINEFRPDFIRAYPSTITIMARFMRVSNIRPFPSIKAILLGSENLYSWQRELLEEIFECRIYSWYGHTEMCALAGECEKSTNYHIFPEYGYVEIIGKGGKSISGVSKMGEIVATSFNNFAMPFIRYRTMDLAQSTNAKCECGRSYPLLKNVEGRLQELIVANDGSLISLGPVIFGIHDIDWAKIKQIQFIQDIPGELTIQVVKDSSYPEMEIEAYVLRLFNARLEGRCRLDVRFVDYIPRTQRGKYRYLIQKIPIEF